ncbi:hypothetical protein ACFL3B_00495 [Gemmatimonadota bacterium]
MADIQLAAAIGRWLNGPPNDVAVAVSRGSAMLSVAENDLKTFEHDSQLKGYTESNHIFADLLVPCDEKSIPILFWLSTTNSQGVHLIHLEEPRAFVIALGPGYSFGDLCSCVASALSSQSVALDAKWFVTVLQRNGVNPKHAEFASIVGAP